MIVSDREAGRAWRPTMGSVPPSPKPTVTRNDVARLAGVSTAVVSYVLNESKNVSPKTAAKVHEAVAMLGYRPNQAARALRLGSPEMLGMIVPDATNPFFAQLAHEVELAAEHRGLALLTANADGSEDRELGLLEKFVSRSIDGILLSSSFSHPDLRPLLPTDVPLVLLNQYDAIPGVHTVGVDLYEGARLGVGHLAEHGHGSVGLLAGETSDGSVDARQDGWNSAVEEYGLVPGPVVRHGFSSAGGYAAGRDLLDAKALPSALFVSSDRMAICLLLALHEAGVRVPEDVAIVSFDGIGDAEFAWPPLTTVAQPVREMARAAVAALVDSGAGESKQLFMPSLVRRASCGCPWPPTSADASSSGSPTDDSSSADPTAVRLPGTAAA
jgi:LacI family transcriptional regulator